jgi:hypothetical protein
MKIFIGILIGVFSICGCLYINKLLVRQVKGTVLSLIAPNYSRCYRCGMPWKFTQGHSTPYNNDSGCFPLCEKCWGELTPQERLPYYKQLWIDWQKWGEQDIAKWNEIEKAVLEGK